MLPGLCIQRRMQNCSQIKLRWSTFVRLPFYGYFCVQHRVVVQKSSERKQVHPHPKTPNSSGSESQDLNQEQHAGSSSGPAPRRLHFVHIHNSIHFANQLLNKWLRASPPHNRVLRPSKELTLAKMTAAKWAGSCGCQTTVMRCYGNVLRLW